MNNTTLSVPGLDCPSEEKLIRNALRDVPEIEAITFNFMTQEVMIKHRLKNTQLIVQAILSIGMQAQVKGSLSLPSKLPSTSVQPGWLLLGFAGSFSLLAEIIGFMTSQEQAWPVITLALAAIILTGKVTLTKGLMALRTSTLNIHFLMMVAIVGALLIGEWPEAAMVSVLFALAERIESYSLEKARQAINNLMTIAPDTATVQLDNGSWQVKSVNEIKVNHILWVKPGERIPLDGIITAGQSYVNQAPITGESLPVEKKIGDAVYAGTINERGSFEFQVTKPPGDTLLAKIIRIVQQAQSERAPTQRFVDQFSHYYTPSIVVLAVSIAILPPLVWGAAFYPWLYKALMLLVIACPCALVISTPVTVVSGLAAAAKNGILIKGGTYLEQGHLLKAIAFDKTGTLTQGKPVVTQLKPLTPQHEKMLLQLAASLDVYSEHPVAIAIVSAWHQAYSTTPLLSVTEFEATIGRGVTGVIQGHRYYLGNHQWMEEMQVCNTDIETLLKGIEKTGQTTVILSTDTQALAVLAVADTIRDTSMGALQTLHALGIKSIMLTGDNAVTANVIAKHVGIDEIRANLLPTDKLTTMDNLLARYQQVGMVGDGMNDAPALARATIGFAMGHGTDTAIETADITLMDDNLQKLPFFIRLSKKTAQILWQNISLSIGIKMMFFILTFLNLSALWMAVFADMGVSLIVVANGLRLLRFR